MTPTFRTSLEDAGGFSRDAFGRQSMSEKRHATLDAKSTDTYQRNKKLKEERERIRQEEKRKLAAERNLQGLYSIVIFFWHKNPKGRRKYRNYIIIRITKTNSRMGQL